MYYLLVHGKSKKIVKEELLKALLEIKEMKLQTSGEEQILYNFEAGRAFGINKLAIDIKGLNEYYMSDYIPRSEIEERWVFEIENNYGGSQLIEITHKIDVNYNSFWNLKIAEVEPGSKEPQITDDSGYVEEYQTFIERVNETLESKINPNLL